MAKRFTDTELWDKEWFMELPCKLKCLVKFVRDKSDLSGVWSPNWIIANTYIGEKVCESDLLNIDNGKQFVKIDSGKIFCIGFVDFQYGTELSEKSPVHRKIISLLNQHGIFENYQNIINISDVFKIPNVENYNNGVLSLIKNKQKEFKYILYRSVLSEIAKNQSSFDENIINTVYKKLETKYLSDTYRIFTF